MNEPNTSEKTHTNNSNINFANIKKTSLDIGNFITTAILVSTLTSSVQSPLSALILNNISKGKVLSDVSFISMAIFARLYRGYPASLPGGTARSAYMNGNSSSENQTAHTSAKNTRSESNNNSSLKNSLMPIIYAANADTLLTQYSEMRSQLIRFNIIDKKFNCWTLHNFNTLMRAAFIPRLTVSFTNYAAFFVLNDVFARNINTESNKIKYFISGAASGAFAALIMLPVTYLRDTITIQMTQENGKLAKPKTIQILSNFYSLIKQQGLKNLINENLYRLLQLGFLRILRSSATLAITSGVINGIGCKPLNFLFTDNNNCSFFNKEKTPDNAPYKDNKPPTLK